MKKIIRKKLPCLLLMLILFLPLQNYLKTPRVFAESGAFGFSTDEGYAIVPLHAGSTCFDQDVSGKRIMLHKSHRGDNQTWFLRPEGDGYYTIENKATGEVLETGSSVPANGTMVLPAKRNGSDTQLFKIEPAGDGTYAIKTKTDERFGLDIEAYSTDNGAKVYLYTYNHQRNQRFRFVHMTTNEDISVWGASYSDCAGKDWDIWDGSSDNRWYYADTNTSIYYIKNCAELAGLSQLVRDGVSSFENRVIVLTKDLNLAGIEWSRIGNNDRPFRGSINGNGHAIAGLSITTTDSENGFIGHLDGGSIVNLRIKGSVSGDFNTGGVVGMVSSGHLVNIYSEVTISRSIDDNLGGIVGRLGYGGYMEHCTQNARVNSGDKDPDRGGIAGYCTGIIRYCVNRQSIECNWNYVGGIAGECVGGKIEFCANYGKVYGGGDTKWAGGITGAAKGDAIIFGCYNEGDVWSDDDDYIGGICGQRTDGARIYCCINLGNIWGDDCIGGINGEGMCRYCFNAGQVNGDDNTGAVSGSATQLHWSRALSWTSPILEGDGPNNGAEWISAEDVIGGKLCYDLNAGPNQFDMEGYGGIYKDDLFRQNIGGDMFPDFTGQIVKLVNGKYVNDEYEVRISSQKDYGSVLGAGAYTSGQVVLKAEPQDGCVFDHFEVSRTEIYSKPMYNGNHNYPRKTTKVYSEPEITLTDSIDGSYEVKAVFGVYDDTPDDLKQKVKIELECTDDTDGWNSNTVPAYLVDSSGEKHLWEFSKDGIDGEGRKVEHTFDLGAASPVYLEVIPDFGGGFTFHDLGLKANMWVNDAQTPTTSESVMIRSYPFISSKYDGDYMHILFSDSGRSTVGTLNEDGTINNGITYDSCSSAWQAAKRLGNKAVIRLESAWLTTGSLELSEGEITLDLNGFPIIRSLKKTKENGEVIKVGSKASLNITDSMPGRKSCSAFSGGSIQGGRSTNGAGILDVRGNLTMKGGAIYNGGTTDVGGGLKVTGGNVTLTGTLISDCWSNKAWVYDNDGGGIAIRENGKVNLKDVVIRNCTANEKGGAIHMNSDSAELFIENVTLSGNYCNDDEGGAVYQDGGSIRFVNGTVKNNRAKDDNGGAIYQNKGTLYCENVTFDRNEADVNGGAIYIDTYDQTWLLNCVFTNNYADEKGGAIYNGADYLYLRDTSVTGNGSKESGGGIYVERNVDTGIFNNGTFIHSEAYGSVDVAGKVIIRNNDGEGTYDNLVLEEKAYIYNQGLTDGAEIHLRSTSDGSVNLSDPNDAEKVKKSGGSYRVNESQLKFFIPDHGKIKLTDPKEERSDLIASAFTVGKKVLWAGLGVIVLASIAGVYMFIKKKRGGKEA